MRHATLRTLTLAALSFVFTFQAQSQSAPETTARQYVSAFNSGDMARTASFNSSSGLSIVDDFAPYSWSGPTAFSDWGTDFGANAKANGVTEPKVTLGKVLVLDSTATQAYLVFSSRYTYKQKGVAMREDGRMAVAMRKEGDAWKIAAWSWAGTVPKPAAP